MSTATAHKIIDGDGHVVEDIASIVKYMPEEYVGRSFSEARGKNPFPPIDHLHTANRHYTPKGAFANVGREGWELFLEDVGIGTTVLYTSAGLAFGKIVSRDWAIELARAYNNWLHDTYLSKSPRFKAMGLIPLQEPAEAVIELRRIVRDLGFSGAMLPSMGVNMPHLGSEKYWPIYGEAERLGCAIAIHGGAHENLLMDDMSPYAVANALGHPMSQMIAFAGIIFNGVFDKFPGLRVGFMEAGCAWLLTCMERFSGSWAKPCAIRSARPLLAAQEGRKDHRLYFAPHRRGPHLHRLRGRGTQHRRSRAHHRQQALRILHRLSARGRCANLQARARRAAREQPTDARRIRTQSCSVTRSGFISWPLVRRCQGRVSHPDSLRSESKENRT